MTRALIAVLLLGGCAKLSNIDGSARRELPLTTPRTSFINVTTYRYDNTNLGVNSSEMILTPQNVNSNSFGLLYSIPVDGDVYAEPLYVSNLNVTGGTYPGMHNTVFVATENDSLYALDADTGQLLWQDSLLTPDPPYVVTPIPAADQLEYALVPVVGITSTPVIDLSSQTLYVVTRVKEAASFDNRYIQKIHAISLADGSEKFGGPTTIADTSYNNGTYIYHSGPSVKGSGIGGASGTVTFNALRQMNRAALTLSSGIVYIGYASLGDIALWA